MEYDYRTERLHIHTATPEEVQNVLDFHERNKDYFEQYEAPRPEDYYTLLYQLKTLSAEAVSFTDNYFIRYYISPLEDTSSIIGTVSFKKYTHHDNSAMMLGYKIDHMMWRKGYAYEALSFLIPRIFLSGITYRLEALVAPDNQASIALLKKLGFSLLPEDNVVRSTQNGNVLHQLYFLES